MIILFIQLLTTCTGEGNKTDHQPMIYDPNKTSVLDAEPFKCSAFITSSLAKGYDSGPPSLHPWRI